MSRITRRSAIALLASAGLGLCAPCFAANQDSGQELASKGHELLLSGHPAEALAALKEAARVDPTNPWVFNLLGRAYTAAGQPYQATESFRMALRIDPGDGYSRMMLDILAQHPIAAPKVARKPQKHKRISQLEEDARKELDGFAQSGKPSVDRLILIDPGHGGVDKGVTGAAGLAEKAVTLELARKVAAAVEGQGTGVKALLTREGDHDVPLWARSAMAGLFGADLFVSLHCTTCLPGYSGLEVYSFSPEPSDSQAEAVAALENGVTRFERIPAPMAQTPTVLDFLSSWQSRRLAAMGRKAAERLAGDLKPEKPLDLVHLRTGPLKVLRNAGRPAVLVEAGFLSNPAEEAALKDGGYLEKLAGTLAQALTRSLG